MAFGLERKKVAKDEVRRRAAEALELVQLGHAGQAQARAALRRPAAARGAGPRAGQPPAGAAARRAARRARPAPAQAAADRAQAHPAGRRDHVRARHARPGGGHEHGRHDRGDERRAGSSRRAARPSSTSARGPSSWPTSSASRTSSTRGSSRDNGLARLETHDGATLHVPSERCGPHADDNVRVGRAAGEDHAAARRARRCPTARNVLRGTVMVAAFLGVSIQYVVRAAGGEELNVFAQNTDGSEPESLGAGPQGPARLAARTTRSWSAVADR